MAETINIGGINITLGATSDQLKSQLTNVQKMFNELQSKGSDAFDGLSLRGIAAAVGLGVAFDKLKDAIEETIDAADELGKTAQRLGIAAPQLSKLQTAAQQADVSIDDLNVSLRLLSQRISETDPGSQGALLFQTLGIRVKDANGNLKDSGTILEEIADKFATYRDGVNKTALAIQLFGRNGASLIPFLNQGGAAIQAAGDAAAKAGKTIDQDLVTASTKFNDVWTDLKQNLQGGLNTLTKQLLPGLQGFADELKDATDKGSGFDAVMKDIAVVFQGLATGAVATWTSLTSVGSAFDTLAHAMADAAHGDIKGAIDEMHDGSASLQRDWDAASTLIAKIWNKDLPASVRAGVDQVNSITRNANVLPNFSGGLSGALADQDKKNAPKPITGDDISKQLYQISQATTDATTKIAQLNQMYTSGLITAQTYDSAVTQALQAQQQFGEYNLNDVLGDSTQTVTDKMNALDDAVHRGIITFQQYKQNSKSVADENEQNWNTVLSTASTTLTALFSKSKTAAIASALINTYEGITQALKLPFPLNWIQAGLVGASGFAQVQSIRSQSMDGGGGSSSASTSSAASQATSVAPVAAGPQQTLEVVGLSRNALFSGDAVRQIAQSLIDYQKDGGKVVLA